MTSESDSAEWLIEEEPGMTPVARECQNRWDGTTTVGLVGPLGSGKTTFVRHLVRSLGGAPGAVRSPTFALVQEYPELEPPVIHADLYRTESADQQRTIGLEEFFGRRLVLVEWAGNWALGWPPSAETMVFEHVDPGTRRVRWMNAPPDEVKLPS